jgi:hypothetical protein
MSQHFIYIGTSLSQNNGKDNKIGRSQYLNDRLKNLDTSYSIDGFSIKFLIICESLIESQEIEEYLHSYFWDYSTTKLDNITSHGTEWFTKNFTHEDIKKALLESNYNNKIITDKDEIDKITEKSKREEIKNNYIKKMNQKSFERKNKLAKLKARDYQIRNYQQIIIKYMIEVLLTSHKIYLELATGGGKSYIVYNILNKFKPDTIIIFSPRKNINEQNTTKKYLSLINNEYDVYNCSERNDFDEFKRQCEKENKKMIIVACPQNSHKKVYDLINNNNLNDIFIWFDEAHHTIENWINKKDNSYTRFFLESNKINKHVFTSASPNKIHVEQNKDIFGELYTPIKVKELIVEGWLCPIIPRIPENNNSTINLTSWIIEQFESTNSNFGFSFHHLNNNAFILFYKHYLKFKKNTTTIKPYLLIDFNNSNIDDKNKKLLDNIDLSYNFKDIKSFENEEKSIAYLCKMYNMGYDFNKLDYIIFSDPKCSIKDIIQCIGRGLRSDKLGEFGKNLLKFLNLMIPIHSFNDKTEYNNVKDVLRYLILDLELDIIDILIKSTNSNKNNKKNNNCKNYTGENNKSILLDLIYEQNIVERPTTKILYRFCKKYNINTEEKYNHFKNLNPSIPLKDNIYQYNGFCWKNVLDPNGEQYYSNQKELDSAQKIIESNIDDDDKLEELYTEIQIHGWIPFIKYDPKFPPMKIGELEHYF